MTKVRLPRIWLWSFQRFQGGKGVQGPIVAVVAVVAVEGGLKISCQEPAESSKVKVKTEKGAKTKGDKGEKGEKAKAKVSKDKLKSKAEKKPKAEKAEKVPKAQGPRDTLDWPKGLSSTWPNLALVMRLASKFSL